MVDFITDFEHAPIDQLPEILIEQGDKVFLEIAPFNDAGEGYPTLTLHTVNSARKVSVQIQGNHAVMLARTLRDQYFAVKAKNDRRDAAGT